MSRPVARPTASSEPPTDRCSGRDSEPISAAKDSSSPCPSRRISRRQLDTIASELTDYDQTVLRFVSEVRLSTGRQLARRLWSAKVPTDSRSRAARRVLTRLESFRVIDRLTQRIGGVRGGSSSIIYGIGPAGRRLLVRSGAVAGRLGTPGDRYVAHTLAATELVVRLHEASLAGELDLIERQTEPDCWRPYLGVMGARLMLKPDLFVRIGVGALEDRWFVEVDMATESTTTIAAKAKRYLEHFRSGSEQARHGVYPRVIWTVPDRRRGLLIEEALGMLPGAARQLFVIWPYDEVIGRLAAEAQA